MGFQKKITDSDLVKFNQLNRETELDITTLVNVVKESLDFSQYQKKLVLSKLGSGTITDETTNFILENSNYDEFIIDLLTTPEQGVASTTSYCDIFFGETKITNDSEKRISIRSDRNTILKIRKLGQYGVKTVWEIFDISATSPIGFTVEYDYYVQTITCGFTMSGDHPLNVAWKSYALKELSD